MVDRVVGRFPGTLILAFTLVFAFSWTATADQTPWLFSPVDQNGTVACVDQGASYLLVQTMTADGYKDWESLRAALPKAQWVSFMVQDGCLIVPPDTQWEELGADHTVAFMRLYPWDETRLVTLFFPLNSIVDAQGNPPRQGGQF